MNSRTHRPLCVALAVMIFSGLLSMSCFGQETIEQRFQKSLQAELKAGPIISAEIIPPAEVPPLVVPRPLTPIPDPAFQLQPTFDYLAAAGTMPDERLPRGLLFVAPFCGPCERIQSENPDLVGGPDSPIEVLNVPTAGDRLQELGVKMDTIVCPVLVILDEHGRIHDLGKDGRKFGCHLAGYHNTADLKAYLTKPDHGVSLDPLAATSTAAVLENAPKSIDTLAAALAWHVLQSESEISNLKSQMPQADAFGSLLEVNADVPDSALELGRKILSGQRMTFPAAGLTLDWSGPKRTIALERGRVTINPGVAMTVSKWRFRKSCRLDAIAYADDLSAVTFELSGMLDLTVNLR